MTKFNNKKVAEFNVHVPWGHLAVKAWGNPEDPHVLMIHGICDNAGTFDRLMPFLPNSLYYICVDLPGHGRSSYFPPHIPIHSTDFIIPVKLLVDYFKQERYIFLCHSYGAQMAFLYSRIYPKYVEKMIMLDVLPFYTGSASKMVSYLKRKLEGIDNIGEPRAYTYDEAVKVFVNNRYDKSILPTKSAEPILERGLIPKGAGKYSFSFDERTEYFINPLHDERYFIETLKYNPVSVPILMIFAKLHDGPRKKYRKTLEQLQKSKHLKVMYVDGTHDVHNTHPERVAGYINDFLLKQNAKL